LNSRVENTTGSDAAAREKQDTSDETDRDRRRLEKTEEKRNRERETSRGAVNSSGKKIPKNRHGVSATELKGKAVEAKAEE
jgi:hypothetical protein